MPTERNPLFSEAASSHRNFVRTLANLTNVPTWGQFTATTSQLHLSGWSCDRETSRRNGKQHVGMQVLWLIDGNYRDGVFNQAAPYVETPLLAMPDIDNAKRIRSGCVPCIQARSRLRFVKQETAAEDLGVVLMRKAFAPAGGPLIRVSDPEHERRSLADLLAGAVGSYKNPHSHRHVTLTDPSDAQEMLMSAPDLNSASSTALGPPRLEVATASPLRRA